MRDEAGKLVMGWKEGGYIRLDFRKAGYRRQVAARCKAVMESGAADGVMLDWWRDDDDRLALIREVRSAVGDAALIIANANDRITPRTAPYINGYFMECHRSATAFEWSRIATTLSWAEKNLRQPRVNCLESWYHKSRNDLDLVRAVTTLSLTHSDGYCLFSDPNPLPTPDHLHDWYPFWDRNLGRPLAPGTKREDGSTIRHFEHGSAVYNPMGNDAVQVTFSVPHVSLATGQFAKMHTLNPADGGIYLKK